MATYSTFEELKVWQTSRALNMNLFKLLMDKDDRKFGFLINHIFKMAGSVMDNIAGVTVDKERKSIYFF
jgi:hypothetical protein